METMTAIWQTTRMTAETAWNILSALSHGNPGVALVAILVGYHLYCGKLLNDFKNDRNRHGHVFYRWLNEFPVLVLFATVILAVVKPF